MNHKNNYGYSDFTDGENKRIRLSVGVFLAPALLSVFTLMWPMTTVVAQ